MTFGEACGERFLMGSSACDCAFARFRVTFRRCIFRESRTVGYISIVNYLEGLNDAQKRAVLATHGPVSVLAGAGSGKTRVLTTRIYHLIRQGVPGEQILAVTFTNKAAREMRSRVQEMLERAGSRFEGRGAEEGSCPPLRGGHPTSNLQPPTSSSPFIATFHGLGRELLESYGSAIGIPRFFSVYDRDDSEKVIAGALKSLDISTKELSPRAVMGRISKAKGAGLTAQAFYEKNARTSYGNRITAEVWRAYDKALVAEKALDFDDLIVKPVQMLEAHADIRAAAQARWQYLHIDEYQDTNELQEQLSRLLLTDTKNIFVVGDIDQAIYGWRGARMENLLEFEKAYPGAETIVLEQNYRATKNLVDAANAVIEQNKNRKEKRSTTENAAGEPIVIHAALSAETEAYWIARKARALLRAGVAPLNAPLCGASGEPAEPVLAEDIAILYRTNFQSRALEEGLLRAGVPYKLLGTRFFERKEVKDALAWVRLALDPSREADKIRAAASPSRGIGKVTLAKLAAGERDALKPAEKIKVEAFEAVIQELALAADALLPSEFVKLVVEKNGMKKAMLEEGSEEDRERFENVEELASVAARHDTVPGKEGIANFLADAALSGDQDELDRTEKRGVNLMTVHAAKGLEFKVVFVSGMEEGLFPHQGMGNDTERDEEEERRLFYVAITRAKERLFLTLARVRKIYGSDFLSEPSSFLQDLDRSLTVFEEDDGEAVIEA